MLASLLTLTLAAPGLGVRLDVGVTLPVSAPQTRYFTPGPGGTLTGELGLLPFLSLEAQLGSALLPRTPASPTPGTVLSIGAGARLHRQIGDSKLVPWGDVVLSYGAAGGSRLPLTLSTGLAFKPLPAGFLVGVFVRWQHFFALAAPGPGDPWPDATLVSCGVSLEYFWAPRGPPAITP